MNKDNTSHELKNVDLMYKNIQRNSTIRCAILIELITYVCHLQHVRNIRLYVSNYFLEFYMNVNKLFIGS